MDDNPEEATTASLSTRIIVGRLQKMMKSAAYGYINIFIIAGCAIATFLYMIFCMTPHDPAESKFYSGLYTQYFMFFLFLVFVLFVRIFAQLYTSRNLNNAFNLVILDQHVSPLNALVLLFYLCISFATVLFISADDGIYLPVQYFNLQFLIFLHLVYLLPKMVELSLFICIYIILTNAKIPSKKVKYDERVREKCDECVICKDKFEDGNVIRMLKCKHYFHGSCIEEWNKVNSMCPLCKRIILDGSSIREIVK